jgi:hypothetical protein
MSVLIYKEQEYPFNADFDYIVKGKNGEEVKHTLSIRLTEKQLAKFDMTDKNVADALEESSPDVIAKNMMTAAQIKELKKNVNNEYQYKMILTNISGYIMGFISTQRVENGISAMSSSPVMKKYGRYLK